LEVSSSVRLRESKANRITVLTRSEEALEDGGFSKEEILDGLNEMKGNTA